ncbi:hypothetical protein M405DRAFT_933597 [Rhizopogon salebrosus TDB-379]|nr:hypothetical protein M405DRAFT_933597 [Rhizopogon salebrosus TDB-379]
MVNVPETYGTVLLGGFIATILSGIITAQAFHYFRRYPSDTIRMKAIVGLTWILDCIHTVLVCTTSWIYMIHWFDDEGKIEIIPIPLAISVSLTAFLSLIVHCFFAHRIYKLTHNDWRISVPIVVCALLRLIAAVFSTVEMIYLQTLSAFRRDFSWVFTAGLLLSCVVDVFVTVVLCVTLRASRSSYSHMDRIFHSVVLYTLENNSLTGAAAIISMVCWVTMPNLVFLGIHFVLSKLYANSMLASLNFRKKPQEERPRGVHSNELPVAFPGLYQPKSSKRMDPGNKLEIDVGRTTECEGVNGYLERNTPSDMLSPASANPSHISCTAV